MTPVMLLLLYAACVGVNATATPVAALPGAPAGYVVLVTAPPGSEVVLYPAPGAPPVTATPTETRGGCIIYRAGPLALGSDAYVAVNASGHVLIVHLTAPEPKPQVRDSASTATHGAPAAGGGDTTTRVDTAGARGGGASASSTAASASTGGRRLLDIAVILLAVVFLLASRGARRSSSLS